MNFQLAKTCFKHWLRYGQYAYDPDEYIVLHDRQLLIQIISKVACTSIKASIGKSIGIHYELPSGLDIHRHPNWNDLYGEQIKPYSHYDLICFVRNPLSRLVSCYVERVLYDGKNPDFPGYYFADYPISIPANSSFSAFARQVCKTPDYAADRHFKSQYYSIFMHNKRRPDFIGRLENLNEDWKKVAQRYNLPDELLRLNKLKKSASLPNDWRDFYSAKDWQILRKRYKKDIDYFGYK